LRIKVVFPTFSEKEFPTRNDSSTYLAQPP
jgi:hypothetical protein